jgi:nucleoside-diphosphate-sugar epimerase
MKVFVAGATGALGRPLVRQLVERGHEVTGMTRSESKTGLVRGLGATPVVADALDPDGVARAVAEANPDVIVHQLTAIGQFNPRHMERDFARTNELRTKGTDHLLAAGRAVGVKRFVAQSFAPWPYARSGGMVKTEDDPLDPSPPANARQSFDAMAELDRKVVDAGGTILRYGLFYGAANDGLIEPVRKRQYPIIGEGNGITSWIHLDDAAAATVLALEHDGGTIYNVVDDEPAPVREWLPVLVDALGAKPPRRFPAWVARLLAGEAAVVMGTDARGASNAKAKRELGWTLRYPTWRTGFAAVYSALRLADAPRPHAGPRTSEAAR